MRKRAHYSVLDPDFCGSERIIMPGHARKHALFRRPVAAWSFVVALICLLLANPVLAGEVILPNLRGHLAAHDPSTIVKCKDRYYTFHTGKGIQTKWSSNKVFWAAGPTVFANPPAWTTNTVPEFAGTFWAPDVIYFSNKYHLYYSCSSWGKQVSAIGLATNPTLDPADPAYRWTDQGMVINSVVGSPYNTIDPGVTWDKAGKLWLVFGSYWNGIYLVQLDPTTGLRLAANSPVHRLAWKSAIEAAWIYPHGSYYYLFVNWGSCCSGVNSSYNIRVGRSAQITGPYLDRNGVDLVNGGGSAFMVGNGRFAGPGHPGVLVENGQEWLSHHYYDANSWSSQYGAFGTAKLGLAPLRWTTDNWPYVPNEWSAIYDFQNEAADASGQHTGLLKGGANIVEGASPGRALNLDGSNSYVWLPPAVAYGQTFAAVVNWRGGGAWQRIFDFGVDTTNYVMLTPASADNALRCDFRLSGATKILQWNRPLPSNTWAHVAVTLDGSKGVLYVNGTPVATNTTLSQQPYSLMAQTNHLGRSKFTADPDFNGLIAGFRAHSRVLSPSELVAPVPIIEKPVDGAFYRPGGKIEFAGRATDFLCNPLKPSGLNWTLKFFDGTATNTVMGPLTGSGGQFEVPVNSSAVPGCFYQLTLVTTDPGNRKTTNMVTVFPGNTANGTNWSAFYPFTNGGQDSSNGYHASFAGGAGIQTEAMRGTVLNLSGTSQYASFPRVPGGAQATFGWVKWRGGTAWQRVFDFGQNTASWFFFTPKASSGLPQCGITTDRPSFVQTIEFPDPFPTNVWTHVAVVMDGRQGIGYVNGRAVALNNSINLLPTDVAPINVWLGRSQWTQDPYFNGQLDYWQLSSQPLSQSEIKAAVYPPLILTCSRIPGSLRFTWPDWATGFRLQSTTNSAASGWSDLPGLPVVSGGYAFRSLPLDSFQGYYRLRAP